MKKPSILSRPTWLLPARTTIKTVSACAVLVSLAGCAGNPNNDVLIDPLKQRLIAREDIALQNLLFARVPAYSYAAPSGGGRSYSYLDEPYDGPVVEPPLPDLNLLPEDMPPWEELEPLPQVPGNAPSEAAAQPTPVEPVPMEAGNETSFPSES
jgi:hypothetical protein